MNRNPLLIFALSLLPAVCWAQAAEPRAPAVPVIVEPAKRDTFSATLWVSGTVISQNDARIAAETAGRIVWVADVGSRILQGEALARIDATDLRLELADSSAQLDSLNAQFKYRGSNLDRLRKLAASNNAAANQLDEAQSQLDMTRQEIKRFGDLGSGLHCVLIAPDGSRAYVSGGHGEAGSGGTAAVIDLKTLELAGRIVIGDDPDGMAWVDAR